MTNDELQKAIDSLSLLARESPYRWDGAIGDMFRELVREQVRRATESAPENANNVSWVGGIATDDLRVYLGEHEDDIAQSVNDYADLIEPFRCMFGRKPEAKA